MGLHPEIFHTLADVLHTLSKIILIVTIIRNRSAEGVSLLTQLEYIVVFLCRYIDLLWVSPFSSRWNFTLKIFYISSSLGIVYLMLRVFARTREKEYGWYLATYSLGGSLLAAFPVCLLFEGWKRCTPFELSWTFSIILESVCVLPQLLLLRQTSVPTVLNSYYLVALGSYRAFYLLHWLHRGFLRESPRPGYWTSVVFGLIQTALYVDFAWVYWSRQRVKLRGGVIVDSDDLHAGYLVKRFIGRPNGRRGPQDDDELPDEDAALASQENGTVRPSEGRNARSWGPRGISVSADDTLDNHHDADARMVDPSQFEDDIDDDTDAPPPPAKDVPKTVTDIEPHLEVDSSASEWQDGGSK